MPAACPEWLHNALQVRCVLLPLLIKRLLKVLHVSHNAHQSPFFIRPGAATHSLAYCMPKCTACTAHDASSQLLAARTASLPQLVSEAGTLLFLRLSIHPSIYPSIHPSNCSSTHSSIHSSIHAFMLVTSEVGTSAFVTPDAACWSLLVQSGAVYSVTSVQIMLKQLSVLECNVLEGVLTAQHRAFHRPRKVPNSYH